MPNIPMSESNTNNPTKGTNYLNILSIFLMIAMIVILGFLLNVQDDVKLQVEKKQAEKEQIEAISSKIAKQPTTTNTQTPKINTKTPTLPKEMIYMYKGNIYTVNLQTIAVNKISKQTPVSDPSISPNGKYAYYFDIIKATGGFPRYNIYISDIGKNTEDKLSRSANAYTSKPKWSKDGNLLGVVLFGKDLTDPNYSEIAFIYDLTTKEEIPLSNITRATNNEDKYILNYYCVNLETKYKDFCYEYTSYLAQERNEDLTNRYRYDYYKESKFTKQGYKLYNSKKVSNDLVVLEYYFEETNGAENYTMGLNTPTIPGYDTGTTDTYIVILDEKTNKAIMELPMAIETNFRF